MPLLLDSPLRLPVPGPAFGPYPERPDDATAPLPRWARHLRGATLPASAAPRRGFVAAVRTAAAALPAPGAVDFAASLRAVRAELARSGLAGPALVPALAHALRATEATLGVVPYDTQLLAARILLDNRLAEMATGEGKTLAAMLAAATAALAGVPVHLVTANPYLALRDAQGMQPVYAALGLRVAAVQPGDDEATRRAAWAADVACTAARDLVFDYLRDRLRPPGTPPLLRGLCMAIVDEADSVLIDEARTPFVLAMPRPDAAAEAGWHAALALARTMIAGRDARLDPARRRARLTEAGRLRCDAATALPQAPLWQHAGHRAELVETALAALHLYRRDVDYLLVDGQVEILDATTGRVTAGRRWDGALHPLIELVEGLAPRPPQRTVASLSFQRFFPRYWRLAGTSGTLREARAELRRVYRLAVQVVPLRVPCRRQVAPLRLFAHTAARWHAVASAVATQHARGAPVLVACDSVADADAIATLLQARGLPHQRLDGRQDADEAQRIAQAGQRGAITVATRVAGRGTDIRLGDGVAALGGLQLIDAQANPSARIDRQMHGRAGRAGDPGHVLRLLALDAGLVGYTLPPLLAQALRLLARQRGGVLPAPLAAVLHRAVQALHERRAAAARSALRQLDLDHARRLGFGAPTA